jgi:hypothetical protein
VIDLRFGLHASGFYLVGIDDNDVIAGVKEGGVLRVLFTHEDAGHTRGNAPQWLLGSIHDVPLAHNFPRFGEIRRHQKSPRKLKVQRKPLSNLHQAQKARVFRRATAGLPKT